MRSKEYALVVLDTNVNVDVEFIGTIKAESELNYARNIFGSSILTLQQGDLSLCVIAARDNPRDSELEYLR
ncbi:hypothetical protein MLD38_027519 [Melastoma candidum]|uniref:Uncharacterized protein n=1 Tax=Melastoma candidum TaxID=119954 RepID=A0ACB9P6K0_9MYRT|nr:hypothetical protein MLD38_027519 [Melastoma candidum]